VLKIDRYIMLNFILGIIPVMLLLLFLFSFLTLADALKDVGEGSFTLPDAVKVVVLTTPKRIVDLLPVSALLGGLMGLGIMANHKELMVIRAAGMSKSRIVRPVILVAIALVGLVFVLQFLVIPEAEQFAVKIKSKSLQQTEVGSSGKLKFWTRSNNYLIRVSQIKFDRSLSDIEIYQIDSSRRLTQVYQASRADIVGGNDWLLTDVRQIELGESTAHIDHMPTMLWPDLLSSKQAATLILPIQALSPVNLYHYINYLEGNKINTLRYQTIFWQQVSIPISLLAMAMLALPFLLGSARHISVSQRITMGGVIGIGFYLIQQITGNLANLLGLNPFLTVLTPSLLLLGFAVYQIYKR